jgi:hypothetical protein
MHLIVREQVPTGHGAVKQKEISNYFVLGTCSKLRIDQKSIKKIHV